MANTKVLTRGAIQIVPDGTTAYDSETDFPYGVELKAINFVPSDPADVLVLLDGEDGPVIANLTGTDGYMPMGDLLCKPYLDQSLCTFDTAADVTINLSVAPVTKWADNCAVYRPYYYPISVYPDPA